MVLFGLFMCYSGPTLKLAACKFGLKTLKTFTVHSVHEIKINKNQKNQKTHNTGTQGWQREPGGEIVIDNNNFAINCDWRLT